MNVHEHQHELIAERGVAWQTAPRRSSLDKLRRRELGKKAMWTLRGHLNQFHGERNLPPYLSWEILTEMHERKS